jgi:hypothetical protein
VDQPARVEQRQRRRDVPQVAAGFAIGEGRQVAQIRAIEELHGVVRAVAIDAVLVHFDDARVPELGERVKLVLEQVVRVPARPPEQPLQRDAPPAGLVQHAKHRAHAALSQPRLHAITTRDARSRLCGVRQAIGSRAHPGSRTGRGRRFAAVAGVAVTVAEAR